MRYGFLEKPFLVRQRILDPLFYIQGIAELNLKITKVYVIENDINALSFPQTKGSIVLFGRGYGFDYLAKVQWLHDKQIIYWADIDTHGFAILNQLRYYLPHAQSISREWGRTLLFASEAKDKARPHFFFIMRMTRGKF